MSNIPQSPLGKHLRGDKSEQSPFAFHPGGEGEKAGQQRGTATPADPDKSIFRQAAGTRPAEVEGSVLDLYFRVFISTIMVIVDWTTNVAFFAAGHLDVFEALRFTEPLHWILGIGLVFSEYLAISYSRRLWRAGLRALDPFEAIFVVALWVLVALNFIATYQPLYLLNTGGDETISMVFSLAAAVVISFFSERFLTHWAQLIQSRRHK